MERYEQLRGQALSQGRLSGGCALGLFVHRGMVSWLKVWGGYALAGSNPSQDNPVQSRSSIPIQADFVMILAGMALSCKKGEEGDG